MLYDAIAFALKVRVHEDVSGNALSQRRLKFKISIIGVSG